MMVQSDGGSWLKEMRMRSTCVQALVGCWMHKLHEGGREQGLAGEGGSFPLGGEGSREPASRTCPSTHTEVPLAAAAAAAAGPQGHELASEGPLCLIVGLPTSTDLPPEGQAKLETR